MSLSLAIFSELCYLLCNSESPNFPSLLELAYCQYGLLPHKMFHKSVGGGGAISILQQCLSKPIVVLQVLHIVWVLHLIVMSSYYFTAMFWTGVGMLNMCWHVARHHVLSFYHLYFEMTAVFVSCSTAGRHDEVPLSSAGLHHARSSHRLPQRLLWSLCTGDLSAGGSCCEFGGYW